MNYSIEHKDKFTVIGFGTQISPKEGYIKCPEFWEKEYSERFSHLFKTMIPQNEAEQAVLDNKIGRFALCIDDNGGFEYMIAGTYQGGTVPESMKLYEFPESDWAVFTTKGPLPRSLQQLNAEVWQSWYPNEGQSFLPNGMTTVECYSEGNPTSPDYEVGIWVPVIKK